MLQFSCPGCGKRLRAKPENAGQNCRCPACNTLVPVPKEPAEPLLELDDDPAPLTAPPPLPPAPPRVPAVAAASGESTFSKAKKWITTIGGILFMVLCVGVVKQLTKAAVKEEVLPNPYAERRHELLGPRKSDEPKREDPPRRPDEPRQEKPAPPPSADERQARLLSGTWRVVLTRAGVIATSQLTYHGDGTFHLTISGTKDGRTVAAATARGTWRINKQKLRISVTESDQASLRGKEYEDEILELTNDKLVTRDAEGKVETFHRVRG